MEPVNMLLGEPVGRVFNLIAGNPRVFNQRANIDMGIIIRQIIDIVFGNATIVYLSVFAHFFIVGHAADRLIGSSEIEIRHTTNKVKNPGPEDQDFYV